MNATSLLSISVKSISGETLFPIGTLSFKICSAYARLTTVDINTYLVMTRKCIIPMLIVMYDSYLLKDVHSVLVNFPREYAQESMMLYI